MTANIPIVMPNNMSKRDRRSLACLIGIVIFAISFYFSYSQESGAGDLRYTLLLARDWLAGEDPYLPYKLNIDPLAVPYPFTAVILTIPLTWLPDSVAAGVFSGIGAGILAWFILADAKNWRLMTFFSWPFINSLVFTQWAPYIASMFFTPGLLAFLLVKPQLALPFVLTQKPSLKGILGLGVLLLLSLLMYPKWPLDWFVTVHNFIGFPPLFILPLGPLLLLALLRYKDKRAWLLVLLAAMPQRMVYDQLGALLLAENCKQQVFLVICSWISLPVLLYYHGWENVPFGWQNWILIESYIPSMLVVLLPLLSKLLSKLKT